MRGMGKSGGAVHLAAQTGSETGLRGEETGPNATTSMLHLAG